MKKVFAILLALFISPIILSAQEASEEPERSVHNFEVGAGYNYTTNYFSSKFSFWGPGVFFEYRYRNNSNFDVAGQANFKYGKGEDFLSDYDDYRGNVSYSQVCTKVLFDYNFCHEDCLVSPYLGLGLGLGGVYANRPNYSKSFEFFYSMTPRAGVQIWRFRLTCEYELLTNRTWRSKYRYGRSGVSYAVYSTILALNLGFTF